MRPLGWSCWITMSPLITVWHHESRVCPRCRTQRWSWWKQRARQQRGKSWRKTHRGTQAYEKHSQIGSLLFTIGPPLKGFITLKGRRLCLLFTHLNESVGLLHKVCTQHTRTHIHTHALSKLNHAIIQTRSYLYLCICVSVSVVKVHQHQQQPSWVVMKWFCMMMILDPSSFGKEDGPNRGSSVCAATKPRLTLLFLINP